MDKYVIKKVEIDALPGTDKTHFLNDNAQRNNKSLGDLTGLTGIGFHLIEVPAGRESTEYHVHYYEDECSYILSGTGTVVIGDEEFPVEAGDFIGYRKGGLPHTMINSGTEPLRCLVAGERLKHDVGDYPRPGKRIYRNAGISTDVAMLKDLEHPDGVGNK